MKKLITILLFIGFMATAQNLTTVPTTTVWVLYPATCPAAMLTDYGAPCHSCTFEIEAARQFETDRAAYRYKVYMETKGTTEYWGAKPVRK